MKAKFLKLTRKQVKQVEKHIRKAEKESRRNRTGMVIGQINHFPQTNGYGIMFNFVDHFPAKMILRPTDRFRKPQKTKGGDK